MKRKKLVFELVVVVVVVIWAIYVFSLPGFGAADIFERFSGLELPPGAAILQNNAPFGIGTWAPGPDRCIEVQVDKDTIQKWLTIQPFWGASQWKSGPVKSGFRGKNSIPNAVLDSSEVYYALLPSEAGAHLVVLEPLKAHAWLLMW